MTLVRTTTGVSDVSEKSDIDVFSAWIANERDMAINRSKSPDFSTRKAANPRIECLDAAATIWAEFSMQRIAKQSN